MNLVYSILILVLNNYAFAQEKRWVPFSTLELAYLHGNIFATNDFVRGKNAGQVKLNKFRAYALKLTKQTARSKNMGTSL